MYMYVSKNHPCYNASDYMNYEIRNALGKSQWQKGASPLLALLLENRKVSSSFESFSRPDYETTLFDPLTISGMVRVVERILSALE